MCSSLEIVEISNLFEYKMYSNPKFVQINFFKIQNLFKFNIYSNLKFFQIRNLFKYKKVQK
jgi:hypothetical protein